MDITIVLTQISVLFIMLALGYIIGRIRILTPEGNKFLTQVVLFVALPCTIINSVISNDFNFTVTDTLFYLLVCFLSFGLSFLIAVPMIRLSGGNKSEHGLLTYMSIFNNCGFMGFPVTIAIFGAIGGFYTAIYNIPFNLLSFSVGIMLITGTKNKFNPKLLLNPPLIASMLAIPIATIDFTFPVIITDAIRITGGITTPGAMIVIGSALSYIPVRSVFASWRVGLSTTLRLIIIPAFTWLVFRLIISDDVMLGVLVILSAMPTAAQSTMFAIQYNANENTASAGVLISTLLCAVTLPLIVYIVT